MKFLWKLYYFFNPVRDKQTQAQILAFCRTEGVRWQEVTYDRSRFNNSQNDYLYW